MLTLFDNFITENLVEADKDDDFHSAFTAITIDPEKNEFRTINGTFKDKKDVYEKLTKRGLIVRKVLETPIFNWILKNAASNLEAYAMLSTAFSKWRGNNLLSDKYVKLLNDIPQLNREKIKGNPNTKGRKYTNESALEEDRQFYKGPEVDKEYTTHHKLTLYPITLSGERDPKYLHKPIITEIDTFDTDNPKKEFDDPEFYRLIFKLLRIDRISGNGPLYPAFDVIVDDNYSNPRRLSTTILLNDYASKNKNPNYHWGPNDLPAAALGKLMKKLQIAVSQAKEDGDEKAVAALTNQLKNVQKQYGYETLDKSSLYFGDELQRVKEIKQEIWNLSAEKFPVNLPREIRLELGKERKQKINQLRSELQSIENKVQKRIDAGLITPSAELEKAELDNAIQDVEARIDSLGKSTPSGPFSGGDSEGKFLSKLDSKQELEDKVKRLYKKLGTGQPVKLKTPEVKVKKGTVDKIINDYQDRYKAPTQPGEIKKDNIDIIKDQYKQEHPEQASQVDDAYIQAFKNEKKDTGKSTGEVRKYFIDNPTEFQKAFLDALNNPEKEIETEAAVNQGVTAMYRTQPIGGQPMDVYPTNRGLLSVGGLFMEDDVKEGYSHQELNPLLFENEKLKPEIRDGLLKIADKFKEYLNLPYEPVNIYFTGSSANYNYNDQSDIDLHLVYDFEKVGVAAEILSKYLVAAKKVFNDKYDIEVKGIPVELGAEDLNQPLIATAVYSVMNDDWVKKPNSEPFEIAEPDMPYYQEIINKIEEAIQSQDSNKIEELWKELGQLRKDSLAQEGEFGPGNALFKKLRNMGYLTRLKDAYYNSASKELSVESLEEIL